jgi:hypothetical protein
MSACFGARGEGGPRMKVKDTPEDLRDLVVRRVEEILVCSAALRPHLERVALGCVRSLPWGHGGVPQHAAGQSVRASPSGDPA